MCVFQYMAAVSEYAERPASRPGRSEHLNLLQQFANAHGAKSTTGELSSSVSAMNAAVLREELIGKVIDEDDGEERYSVYDDDESWPRKLSTEEWDRAGELFDAVEVGDLEKTEEIMKQFPALANVIRLSQGSDFPLYLAAGMGDLGMVQLLVAHNCSVHARTVHGHTALHAAALFGHPNIVSYLLGCGLEVNAVNTEGFPLVEEVLEDIEYDTDESEIAPSADPKLLECAAIVLLENGAHLADPEIYADKFCDEYKDVADHRLQKLLLAQLDRFMEEEETKAKLADDRLHSSGMYASDDSDGENDAEGKEPQVTPVKEPSPARGKTTRLRRRQYSEGTPKQVSPMASPGLAPTPPVRKGKSSETTPKRPTPGTKTPLSKKIAAVTPKSDKEDSDLEISWSEQMAQKEAEVANNSAGSQTPKLPQI